MRYYALATDYDGTIARHGRVDEPTLAALDRLRRSGRRLILVTGRRLDDLQRVFPRVDLFERVVAENGAVVYDPATRAEKILADPPPAVFLEELRKRRVEPLVAGKAIVATLEPHETTVIEVIRDLGLELQVIFNKGAVMVLPSGVNKATGLAQALHDLKLSAHNTVGIGDAENDHAFLAICECSAVVANALPMLKEKADIVTATDHGAGVAELIDAMLDADLRQFEPRLRRHHLPIGRTPDGGEVTVPPYGVNVLLAGTSGSGKSTLAQSLLERLLERRYQFAVVDPEGDYATLEDAVVLGDGKREPGVDEIVRLVEDPERNAVANLLGVPLASRPEFFERLLAGLLEVRSRHGHPHWLLFDEAHHVLPASWAPARQTVPERPSGILLITVHPEQVAPAILRTVDLVIAVGAEPAETIGSFARAIGADPPPMREAPLAPGQVIGWWHREEGAPFLFEVIPPSGERRRHRRKYVEGDLGPDRSFYFQGPQKALNLRVQNLSLFMQIADGVDDATWTHHLRAGDYSRWFREFIKDGELAEEAARLEQDRDLSAERSRALIREAIDRRYTGPA